MAQTSLAAKIKGVADVVFVLDVSGSMSDIIEGVKNHIADFVDKLLNDPQSTVRDVRLGLVTHDVEGRPAVHAAGFVTTAGEFRRYLELAPRGHTEYGLPAIDRALDFPWRERCRRYIVFLTDEPVEGGHNPEFQRFKLNELCQRCSRKDLRLRSVEKGGRMVTLQELVKTTRSERAAEAFLLKKGVLVRYRSCPWCGTGRVWGVRRGGYKCGQCRREWSVRGGSMLEDTRVDLVTFVLAVKLFSLELSAHRAAEELALAYNTTHTLFMKIRQALVAKVEDGAQKAAGEMEMDEAYFGSKRRGKRGRGAAGKMPVFGILKRGGRCGWRSSPMYPRKASCGWR